MGKKTTVVQTGLGDDQYASLASNQSNIATGINDLSTTASEAFNTVTDNQKQITDNQTTLYNQAETNTNTIVGNQEALKTGQTGLSEGQAAILAAVQSAPTVDLSGVESRLGTLDSSVNTGFSNMGSRFDTVDANIAGLGTQVGTGFDNVNAALTTGFDNVNANVNTGFDTAETKAAARETEAQAARDRLQEAVLNGQVGLQDLINQYGQAGATFYENLAAGQATMQANQAGMQEGLNAFQEQYSEDFATQSAFLGDLGNTVSGGFDAVREGQTRMSDNVAQQLQNNVSGQANSGISASELQAAVQAAVANGSPAPVTVDYARIAKDVATGVSGQSQQGSQAGQEWSSKLDTIRNILVNQGDQLDARVRQSYTQLSNSFDNQGKLIANQVDQNGVKTARAIDENGNLLIAQFDQTGQRIMQNSLNINQMLAELDARMTYNAGSNYYMGNLSPANNQRYGIMSPYTTTYRG
jgi:hypothetical protein